MDVEVLWERIIGTVPASGEEVQTSTGLWFKVFSFNGRLFVDAASDGKLSSKLSRQRNISKNDFMVVYSFYEAWVKGEKGVRQTVSKKSQNTSYIFALIEKYSIECAGTPI